MTTIWTLENQKLNNCHNLNNLIRKTTTKIIRDSNKLH